MIALGLVEAKTVKFFGAQATGCSPISDAVKCSKDEIDPQKPKTIARSLAIGNPADGLYAGACISHERRLGCGRIRSPISSLAWNCSPPPKAFSAKRPRASPWRPRESLDRARPAFSADEETVLCITGNGLKTTDAFADRFPLEEAIEPKLVAFEKFMGESVAVAATA